MAASAGNADAATISQDRIARGKAARDPFCSVLSVLLQNGQPIENGLAKILVAFGVTDRDFVIADDHEPAFECLGIALDERVHHAEIGRHDVGSIILDETRAARHVRIGHDRDFFLAVGDALFAEVAEGSLFNCTEADRRALAAGVVERLDGLRISLSDKCAGRGRQISNKIGLFGALRRVVERVPHHVRLAGDHRRQQSRPSAGDELYFDTGARKGLAGEVRVETDQFLEIVRIAEAVRRTLAVLANLERLAGDTWIFGRHFFRFALGLGRCRRRTEKQSGNESDRTQCRERTLQTRHGRYSFSTFDSAQTDAVLSHVLSKKLASSILARG